MTAIALPHLMFLTVLFVAGVVAWLTSRAWPWHDTPAAIAAGIVAGLGAGLFLNAWL